MFFLHAPNRMFSIFDRLDTEFYYTEMDFHRGVLEAAKSGNEFKVTFYSDKAGHTIPMEFLPKNVSFEVSARYCPVYYHSRDYAEQHNQEAEYIASELSNDHCAAAVTGSRPDGLRPIVEAYGYERIFCVLATAAKMVYPDQITQKTREWARRIKTLESESLPPWVDHFARKRGAASQLEHQIRCFSSRQRREQIQKRSGENPQEVQ